MTASTCLGNDHKLPRTVDAVQARAVRRAAARVTENTRFSRPKNGPHSARDLVHAHSPHSPRQSMTLEAVVVLLVLEEDVLVVVEAAGWRDIAAGRRGLLYQAMSARIDYRVLIRWKSYLPYACKESGCKDVSTGATHSNQLQGNPPLCMYSQYKLSSFRL